MAPIPDSAAACALCQWPKTMTFEGEQLSKWVTFKAIFGYIPCVLRGFLQKALQERLVRACGLFA
jgi:hypothetical protein